MCKAFIWTVDLRTGVRGSALGSIGLGLKSEMYIVVLPWNLAIPIVSPRKLLTYLTPYTMMGRLRICASVYIWICSRGAPVDKIN